MNMMKKYFLLLTMAIGLGFLAQAEDLSDGELGFKYDSITPNMVGQATNDHLFVQKGVSFFSGDVQTVWFYLNDDEIYRNNTVQSLTPVAFNSSGDRYNEITYNSFQCDLYLPEGITLTSIENEDGYDINYMGGDRMPTSTTLTWSERGTKVVDGKTYNVYSVVCYNVNSYGCHLSAKNASRYKANGALRKEHTLFALFLQNDNQDEAVSRMDQDLIIANQIFNIYESINANWDSNASTFFYGTGGNNESQVFMKYDRTGMYGSSGYDRNYFFLPDTAALHDRTITLPVRMQNEDAIAGFQTELQLPEGITVVKEQEQCLVSLSDRKAEDHTIKAEEMENGIVKITSQSPTMAAYNGQDGDLFYITLQVPAKADTTYTLHLNNTTLTGTDGQPIYVNDATGTLTVYPYNAGDVNNNGFYTVGDVVTTSRYILGMNPTPFYFMAADMDQSNAIDSYDLLVMSDVVLKDETALPENYGQETADRLFADNLMITAGGNMTVNVKLNNAQEYTAFQTDITLSQGLSIRLAGEEDDFQLDERTSEDFIIGNYQHEGNTTRVMAYSPEVTPIDGNEGTLFTFDIVAADNFTGTGSITFSRTLLSNVEGVEYSFADESCTVKRVMRGDVNLDGTVNVADINVVVNIILGGHAANDVMKRADVNGDGNVTISDINLIISIILD